MTERKEKTKNNDKNVILPNSSHTQVMKHSWGLRVPSQAMRFNGGRERVRVTSQFKDTLVPFVGGRPGQKES